MIYSRRIIADTLINMRDLGGYPTLKGNATNFGVCVRSEVLASLSAKDKKAVKEYGIKTVIDLRSLREADKLKSDYLNDRKIKYYNVPLFDAFLTALNMYDEKKGDIKISELYIEVLNVNKTQISKIIKLIANSEGTVCFHCTAGRDRTGIIAALLLKLVGVPNEDIAADYQISSHYLQPKYSKIFSNPKHKNVPMEFLECKPQNITEMLEYIDKEFKGVENYLLSAGVSKTDVKDIKSKFLDK